MEQKDDELEPIINHAKTIEKNDKIPNGYITVELSSHGMLGAPAQFHMRNFLTEDLMGLALADDEDLPFKVASMLQDLIYEPVEECDIRDFHEKEVIEMLLILYRTCYQTKLTDQDWTLTDKDKEFIAMQCGGKDSDEYNKRMRALDDKSWAPKFDIDLNAIKFYELNDSFKSDAKVKKANGFTCTYTFPRYGDVIMLRKFLLETPEFKEGEKQFAAIRDNVKFRQDAEERWRNGEKIPLDRIPKIPEAEMKKFHEYENKKALFATRAVRALHLKEIEGRNILDLPLTERMELADNPELDHTTFAQVSKAYESMKVGPVEKVSAIDPITHEVVDVDYSFRLFNILQAIRDNKSDGTTIEFE
jgi:hypothetical protein